MKAKTTNRKKETMTHKLDCTEKAYEIMMKHTTWRKPKRMTPKRQKAIDASWPRWKIYRYALKKAGLYGGMAWSAESKYPKIDIDTKEKFTESMLTQHCISHTFLLDIERI